ncbi:MAG TPA: hypothetical protein VL633_10310 [Bacteroidota bacterium]|jgi:hypothetical protein|nr:hypothetical protein [Bacteroidota bacterium]
MRRLYGIAALLIVVTCVSFSQKVREVKKTVELSQDGRVLIDTYKGSITIETWDKPQVDIVARIEPDEWGRDAEENVQRTEIDIDSSPGQVRIKSDYDGLKNRHDWFFGLFGEGGVTLPLVHYTICMPKTARLSVKDYKSDSHIRNVHGRVEFNTYKGTVSMSGLDGSIDLETYKGNAEIDFEKLAGDSRFETYKGDIGIGLPKSSGFELNTDLGRHADMYSDFDAVYHSKHSSRDETSQGAVNGGGPELRLTTEKGTYRLRAN